MKSRCLKSQHITTFTIYETSKCVSAHGAWPRPFPCILKWSLMETDRTSEGWGDAQATVIVEAFQATSGALTPSQWSAFWLTSPCAQFVRIRRPVHTHLILLVDFMWIKSGVLRIINTFPTTWWSSQTDTDDLIFAVSPLPNRLGPLLI